MIQTYSVFAKGWCQAPAFLNRVVVTSLTTTHWPLPSANLTDYNEPVILPDENQAKSARVRKNSLKSDTQSRLKLFPNPAKEYVIVAYNMEAEGGMVRISSEEGKILMQVAVTGKANQRVIPLRALPSGRYYISLVSDGKTVESKILTIVR